MLTEKQIDLFKEIENTKEKCLVMHCISFDKKMGAGIAKPLNEKFKIRERILFPNAYPYWDNKGFSQMSFFENGIIFNLVTKNNYWEKPTYETLRQALEDARNIINLFETRIKKIVMPRIGCGLDKLDWNKVKPIVEEILADFEVVVCYI